MTGLLLPVVDHPWDVTPAEACAIQERLRDRVIVCPLPSYPSTVAGIDVSIRAKRAVAVVVVLAYPSLVPIAEARAEMTVSFPYIPGLLAFSEGPVVAKALGKLIARPDVLMFDAHGLAHPRRLGLASHLGVLFDLPSVGCAKSRLLGQHEAPDQRRGGWTPLTDGSDVIGAVVRTRDCVRPVYVSVGHRADVRSCIALVLNCTPQYRLPEPLRWAHRTAGGGALTPSPAAPDLLER